MFLTQSVSVEREKLFHDVETEWAKRESRTLLKVQQKMSNQHYNIIDSDSDSDSEAEECIVKGRSMALNAFYRIARNTMSMWFKTSEPSSHEVMYIRYYSPESIYIYVNISCINFVFENKYLRCVSIFFNISIFFKLKHRVIPGVPQVFTHSD